jgi:hypothetical protein
MLIGTILTNLSLWYSWSTILIALCPLWLGLCAIGYLITGIGMRSRLLLLCSALHFLTIPLLPFTKSFQILLTGIIISACVTALAELQWDSNGVCNYQSLHFPPTEKTYHETSSPIISLNLTKSISQQDETAYPIKSSQNPAPSNSTPSPTAPTAPVFHPHSHPHQKTTCPSAHHK